MQCVKDLRIINETWITFSPIADLTSTYYNVNAFKVNILSLIFMVASVPFGFAASWVLDTYGLRTSILLSAWLNGIGNLLRNVSTFGDIPNDLRFWILLAGQTLAAISQPFVMFAPTKLAALWFPDSQRATANMMASMANPLGILSANLIAPAMVNGCNSDELPRALWVISSPAFLVVFMATFGVCSSVPPTPPTASADEASESFKEGLKKIVKNKNYWVLCLSFGTGLAVFSSVTSFLDQALCPRGYSNDFAGLCGALMIVGGVVGAIIAGIYVDKTKRFEEVVKISFAIAVVFGVVFFELARYKNQEILLAIMVTAFGTFGFAMYPISMELAVEITYPVAEATSSGLLVVSGQVQGIIIVLATQFLTQPLSAAQLADSACAQGSGCSSSGADSFTPQDWTVPGLFMNGLSAIAACAVILFMKGDYKRVKAEKQLNAERVLNISRSLPSIVEVQSNTQDRL
ncbi:solute carrier family 49 member A3-like isoform X2 [Ostrea edulis]|uniref:solute carrier family 49 member A3-like isoform X2 n=1 Tax=Ostrea edulis TaxID=37623 RepID=UPI0024AF6877|nr:solute carrier family 49 member A3-like isoform X2 [Ostrea edulis]